MSQEIIIRKKGTVRPTQMEIFQRDFDCEMCDERFAIYLHVFYPENMEGHVRWLDAQLRKDHIDGVKHQDWYLCPW